MSALDKILYKDKKISYDYPLFEGYLYLILFAHTESFIYLAMKGFNPCHTRYKKIALHLL